MSLRPLQPDDKRGDGVVISFLILLAVGVILALLKQFFNIDIFELILR